MLNYDDFMEVKMEKMHEMDKDPNLVRVAKGGLNTINEMLDIIRRDEFKYIYVRANDFDDNSIICAIYKKNN